MPAKPRVSIREVESCATYVKSSGLLGVKEQRPDLIGPGPGDCAACRPRFGQDHLSECEPNSKTDASDSKACRIGRRYAFIPMWDAPVGFGCGVLSETQMSIAVCSARPKWTISVVLICQHLVTSLMRTSPAWRRDPIWVLAWRTVEGSTIQLRYIYPLGINVCPPPPFACAASVR